MVDPNFLAKRLEKAEAAVARGERRLVLQREIIARLEKAGQGSSQTASVARGVLKNMEQAQQRYIDVRDQVQAQLAKVRPGARRTGL